MSNEDPGAEEARRIGTILEDLVLSGASTEVLGAFALRHVKRLQASEGGSITRMEDLLEVFATRVATKVLQERQGAGGINDVRRQSFETVQSAGGLAREAPSVKSTLEEGSVAALLSSRAKKVSVKLFGRDHVLETSVSIPSKLHAAVLAQVGPQKLRDMITDFGSRAPDRRRASYVRDRLVEAYVFNQNKVMGTMASSLIQ